MSPDSGSAPEVELVVGFYHPWTGLMGEHAYLILMRPVGFLSVLALSPCGGSNAPCWLVLVAHSWCLQTNTFEEEEEETV